MARKRNIKALVRSTSDEGLAVGYGKPPVHTRFVKGKSGNPSGRLQAKRSMSLMEDLQSLATGKSSARIGNKVRRITNQKILLRILWNEALKGRLPALREILERLQDANQSEEFAAPATELSPEDVEILKRFLERWDDNKKEPKS